MSFPVEAGRSELDCRDKLREIQDNQLYFYYRAGERLGTRLGRN
jgi:hypothetical protein